MNEHSDYFCYSQCQGDDKEEDSFVLEILKGSVYEEGKTKNEMFHRNSAKSLANVPKDNPESSSVKQNNRPCLNQDETFYRFDRKGWICIYCANFNFESKRYLINSRFSESKLQSLLESQKCEKESSGS